jgi:hypothetical protein
MKTCSNRKDEGKQSRGLVELQFPTLEFEGVAVNQASTRRLEGKSQAVELDVDEVAEGVAGLAARGDVGTAGLLDGDGHYNVAVSIEFRNVVQVADRRDC